MASTELWIVAAWAVASCGAGLAVAVMLRRAAPTFRLGRAWAFYSALFAFLIGVVFWRATG